MRFEKLRPGMTVYDVHRRKMGNTTMSTVGLWRVLIVSVDHEAKRLTASWNGNPARTFYPKDVAKWREKEPPLISASFCGARLAMREELKAARALAVGAA